MRVLPGGQGRVVELLVPVELREPRPEGVKVLVPPEDAPGLVLGDAVHGDHVDRLGTAAVDVRHADPPGAQVALVACGPGRRGDLLGLAEHVAVDRGGLEDAADLAELAREPGADAPGAAAAAGRATTAGRRGAGFRRFAGGLSTTWRIQDVQKTGACAVWVTRGGGREVRKPGCMRLERWSRALEMMGVGRICFVWQKVAWVAENWNRKEIFHTVS